MRRASSATDALQTCEREWHLLQSYISYHDIRAQHGLDDIAASMRRLCETVIHDEAQAPPHALGTCFAYLVENNILNDLVSLCLPDEPLGILDEFLRMCTTLVRHIHVPWFLANEGVAHALLQLLRSCNKKQQKPPGLVELVYALCARIHQQPDTLRVLVQLGAQLPKERPADRFPLMTCIVRHITMDGPSGRHMRTSLVWVMHALLTLGTNHRAAWPALYFDQATCSDLAKSLNEVVAHAFNHLPQHLDASGPRSQETWVYDRFDKNVQWYASTIDIPCLGTFIDLLWLIQNLWRLGHAAKDGLIGDQVDQLLTEMTDQFKMRFVEACLEPAIHASLEEAPNEVSLYAMLCYLDVLLSIMEPCTPLSRCISLYSRSMSDLVTKGLQSPPPTIFCALQMSKTLSRWILWHDTTLGTSMRTHHTSMAFPLIAMAETCQTPRFRAAFSHRFLQHLLTVEQAMRDDPVYHDIPSLFHQQHLVYKPIDIIQQSALPSEHSLRPLTYKLRHFFSSSFEENLAVIETLGTLCRSPLLRLKGLIEGGHEEMDEDTLPIITFLLYTLYLQSRSLRNQIPEFDLYLEHRKIECLGHPLEEPLYDEDHSACPLFHTKSPEQGIMILQNMFECGQWIPNSNLRTENPSYVLDCVSMEKARSTMVPVYPCDAPTRGPWSDDTMYEPIDVSLLHVLDNSIVFEEACLEMACILLLRDAWGIPS